MKDILQSDRFGQDAIGKTSVPIANFYFDRGNVRYVRSIEERNIQSDWRGRDDWRPRPVDDGGIDGGIDDGGAVERTRIT